MAPPPGWQLNELQGIDSYVGEIVGDGVRLTFDFGWYSNPLADEGDPLHVVTREEIGGRLAKLVRPKEGTEGAVTGVYFENFDSDEDAAPWGRERLQVNGLGLTLEQQETALVIFRSIRLLASDDQHPIRSDEGIDPDECNWVHNIDACKKGDIPEDGDVVAINPDYSADTPVSNDGVPKPVEGVPDHDYDSGDSSGFKGRPQRLDERCQL